MATSEGEEEVSLKMLRHEKERKMEKIQTEHSVTAGVVFISA